MTPRRPLHGVLLLDKSPGLSSHTALQKARRLYRAEKAGHTGTLDPLATGLLPLCFGAATKFSQISLEADKAYRATLRLGTVTTTGDGEGEVVERHAVAADRAAVEAACTRFVGEIDQLPPMHSALKHEGRALYDYARAGQTVERAPRRVTIRSITVIEGEGERWVIDVDCSKGTYIRTLATDIGAALGCGAMLAELRRTRCGGFRLEQARTLEQLAELDDAARDALLLPPDRLVGDWPAVSLPGDEAARFLTGLRRRIDRADAAHVRVYGPNPRDFLGGAHITGGELIADRLLSPTEVAQQA